MSVQSRIEAGELSRVGWLIQHGYDWVYYRANFGATAPGESISTIIALWDQGIRGRSAGQLATNFFYDAAVPARDVPGQSPGRYRYRYAIQYEYTNSGTRDVQYRSHTITEATQLTAGALDRIGVQLRPLYGQRRLGSPSGPALGAAYQLTDTRVLTLERWT